LVSASKQRRRHVEAERFGGFQVDRQLEYCRLLHRKVGGLLTVEYPIDIARRLIALAVRRIWITLKMASAALASASVKSRVVSG
jgi:hypothetical protein